MIHSKIMLNIIIMGPQGSGKGTQAKLLAEKFNLEHIEPGRLLRGLVAKGGALGQKINYYLNIKGSLVPSDLLFFKVLKPRFQALPQDKGFVLEGAPRELKQAQYLEGMLASLKKKITHVFYIKISEQETFKRLAKRLNCRQCNRPIILGVDVQGPQEKCPHCGGDLFQREDDQPACIEKRLEVFLKETSPVIERFRQQGLLIEINGEQIIAKVHLDIVQQIEKSRRQ